MAKMELQNNNNEIKKIYFESASLFQELVKGKQIGDLKFTEDSITLNTPQVGEIQFNVIERTAPSRLVFSAAKSPVPLTLAVNLSSKSDTETEITSVIDVEIPAMLRPLIGSKMQEAAEKFNELIITICNN